jgi:hypothetical protein
MIIPEIAFTVRAPASLSPGTYPIRLVGTGASGTPVVEGHAALMIGPLLDLWNFVRRPSPQIAMTVVAPFEARMEARSRTLTLERGGSATLELKTEAVPADAAVKVANLPRGVSYEPASRQADSMAIRLKAAPNCEPGTFEISAEAGVGDRWAPSEIVVLTVR